MASAFVGYSGISFQALEQGLFGDPLRSAGYAILLDALYAITPHLVLATQLQHAMGMSTGVLLFAALRRAGCPPWAALLPAAAVLLGGTGVALVAWLALRRQAA